MKRRDFLKYSASAFALPYFVPSRVLAAPGRKGANDKIRVGFIGTGGRARQLMTGEWPGEQAEIVAVADCFLARCHQAAKLVAGSDRWNIYQDYREMLGKEKLDAVFIPTTTHARALAAIHAMQAGLDVYAEKPISLTISEGRTLVRAARKFNRIFQAGTQQRSMPINVFASKLVREGAFGNIHTVIACNFISPKRWTPPQRSQPIPEGLNWDMWCNQTELRPYHADLQFKWAHWWDYDCGGTSWGVSGWGTHALDQVQCVLGTDDTGPVELWPDGTDEQGIMKVTMRYANDTLLKLHGPRRPRTTHPELPDLGAIFVGDKGRIEIKRGQVDTDLKDLIKGAPPNTPIALGESIHHTRNFFECIRTRKKPNADVEYAHRATILCQMMCICRDLNRKLHWDPEDERFIGDAEANSRLSRPRRMPYKLPVGIA